MPVTGPFLARNSIRMPKYSHANYEEMLAKVERHPLAPTH